MPLDPVSIQLPDNYDPSLDDEAVIRDLGALNDELDAAGARIFAGGLKPAAQAKSLRKQPGGEVVIADGPYLDAKQHIGGFSIIECAVMDEALAWARKSVIAGHVPVDVRAIFRVRPNKS